MRVALAVDDALEADLLSFAFERRGHQVLRVDPSRESKNLPFEPVVVVCDVSDAQQTALQRIENAQERFPGALLIATAEAPREPLPAALLRAGAHEVVKAPYNPVELVLRCEALTNRGNSPQGDGLRVADLEVVLARYHAEKNGHTLVLTKLELRLLHCLCEHFPHLAPLDRLLTFGWESIGEPDASLIKTHISHIRRKLAAAGGAPLQILSKQGVGYMLVEAT